jgi:CarD family transcriptional regulator
VTPKKASGRAAAPARTAKAASVAVARVHGDKTVTAAAKPTPAPATKQAPKPAAKAVAKPAAKEAPKQAVKGAHTPAANQAPTPTANQAPKPAANLTHIQAATATPTPTPVATAQASPVPQAKPVDMPPAAKAAAVPPAMKVAASVPPTVATAPRTDQAAAPQPAAPQPAGPQPAGPHPAAPHPAAPHPAAPRQAAPPPRPAPAPGHSDRRPGPVDRIPPRPPSKAEIFVEGDYVVYPTHGVGKVERIATEEIAGHRLELIHITFEENRMTLRVPVAKARSAGLRKLATRKLFDDAMTVLKGRARIKRTMWSRRAQEYEAKINSGDPLAIAEVVRDLHRNAGQPDQSFSERQIYEAAMDRLAAELAALDKTDKPTAVTKLGDFLKTV